MIDHHKILTYHPQANGAIESFNKTLTKGLTKICNLDKNDWDDKIPSILWAYRTTNKSYIGKTSFRMVYGQEAVVPLHFKQHTPKITQILKLDLTKAKEDILFQLQKLEEDILNSIHHQEVKKQQQKTWHDISLRDKNIFLGDLTLLYDSRIKEKPRKLETTWLGPYIVEEINPNG